MSEQNHDPVSEDVRKLAAENMDWQQVVLTGGPPCFYLGSAERFCGRAQRWDGHIVTTDGPLDHKFVSLAQLLADALREERRKTLEEARLIAVGRANIWQSLSSEERFRRSEAEIIKEHLLER